MSQRFSSVLRDADGPDLPGGGGPLPTEKPDEAPRRAGSFTLRGSTGGTAAEGDSPLDPANQSLADALRIMLGLLQFGMIVLAILYAVSGLQTVTEGEKGIRLLFGAKQGDALDPGLQISAPYPLGELIRVKRGLKELDIDKDFWVNIPSGTPEGTSVEKLAPSQSLKPDQGGSGSVLTADGNIAHTKWHVGFKHEDVAKFEQNVFPDDEERLVRAAVKRGVVQACATVTIDELLKQSSTQAASLAARARDVAQRTLDAAESGIVIEQLTLNQTIPPLWVRADFAKVQAAVSGAAKAEELARSDAKTHLSSVAGEVVPDLIKLIGVYEEAIAKNDKGAMDSTLAKIDGLLLGDPVEIDGKPVAAHVSGQVTTTLGEAKRDRAASVTKAKTSLARYEAKLSQYNANPLLMVQLEWTGAVKNFMQRDNVQISYVPAGLEALRVMINADPDLAREIDQAAKKREGEKATKKRMDELMREKFKTKSNVGGEAVS